MKQLTISEDLYKYILGVSVNEHTILKKIRNRTHELPLAVMQISPLQAKFMQMLIKMTNAKKVLEIGTFTGYSALAMALALPKDGKLVTCDLNEQWVSIAKEYWAQAEEDGAKIKLVLGEALESLDKMLSQGEEKSFDFIFIDADKGNYLNYYERALKLLADNGVIAIDNVLWSGKVIDKNDNSNQTKSIKKLNEFIHEDTRVDACIVPISDGLTLVRRRS